MQKSNNEHNPVPAHIKFVKQFLESVHHNQKKSNKQHINFLKDALLQLLDHDAFECAAFRESFSAAIFHFENQNFYYKYYSEQQINQGVEWAKNLLESEVKHA